MGKTITYEGDLSISGGRVAFDDYIGEFKNGKYRVTLTPMEPERYPMGATQPAQIDCRLKDCGFYQEAGRCSNVAPAITLNPQKYACWSYRERGPKLKPCPDCGNIGLHECWAIVGAHRVLCRSEKCGYRTGWHKTKKQAFTAWNRGTPES